MESLRRWNLERSGKRVIMDILFKRLSDFSLAAPFSRWGGWGRLLLPARAGCVRFQSLNIDAFPRYTPGARWQINTMLRRWVPEEVGERILTMPIENNRSAGLPAWRRLRRFSKFGAFIASCCHVQTMPRIFISRQLNQASLVPRLKLAEGKFETGRIWGGAGGDRPGRSVSYNCEGGRQND